ncbi:MAG: hypothetical protein FWH49_01285 [Clostridiales bacterium]|nr:hypothetical protein [Clostridiales bacterium]
MTLLFSLKLVCDLCYYFAIASFFSFYFGGSPLIVTLLLFALCIYASARLVARGKLLRFLPLAFLPLCFFYRPAPANALVLLPAMVYVAVSIYRLDSIPLMFSYSENFLFFLRTYLPLMVLALLMGGKAGLEPASLSFAFVFLTASMLLMHMLRHNPETLSQARFQCMTAIQAVAVILSGVLFSSRAFFSFCGWVLRTMYFGIIAPILVLLIRAILFVLTPLLLLLERLPQLGGDREETEILTDMGLFEDELADLPAGRYDLLKAFLYLAIIALVLYLVYQLFKKLSNYGGESADQTGAGMQRYVLPADQQPEERGKAVRHPVRAVYRNYLIQCRKKGIQKENHMTSADFERLTRAHFQNPEAADAFRSIYIRARYGEKDTDRIEINRMKAILAEFELAKAPGKR